MVEDRQRARELLADLEELLDQLHEKQGVSYGQYEADVDLQDIVERRLEKSCQTCIDLGRLIGRLEGTDLGDATNTEVFVELVGARVLPKSRRQEFIDIGGLRNVLAHRYRHVNDEEIYEIYHDLEPFERFSEAIYHYLHGGTD